MEYKDYQEFLKEESMLDRVKRIKEEKTEKKERESGVSPSHKEFGDDFSKYVSYPVTEGESNVTIEVSDDSKYFNTHKAFSYLVKYNFGNMKGFRQEGGQTKIFSFEGSEEKGAKKELMEKLNTVAKNLSKTFRGLEDKIEEEFEKVGLKYIPMEKESPKPKKQLDDLD